MNATEQLYRDHYQDQPDVASVPRHYDIVQPKWDGHWRVIVIRNGVAKWFTREGNLCLTMTIEHAAPDCIIVGEHLMGTPWAAKHSFKNFVAAFDLLELNGKNLRGLPYGERAKLLKALIKKYQPHALFFTEQYSRAQAGELWEKLVLGETCFEGLIFRSSTAKFQAGNQPVIRVKRTLTKDYYVVAAYEGLGELRGHLGSFGLALTPGGPEICRVGGSSTDSPTPWTRKYRRALWRGWKRFHAAHLGLCVEVEGFDLFPSGALRSPKFLRWRDDKPGAKITPQKNTKHRNIMDEKAITTLVEKIVEQKLKEWTVEVDVSDDLKPILARLAALEAKAALATPGGRVDAIASAASRVRPTKRKAA